MARPLWLRLFGPNGPTSISELRDALLNAPFGQGVGDGHITGRLFELIGRTPVPIERPSPGVDGAGRDFAVREQAGLAASMVAEPPRQAPSAPTAEAIVPVAHPGKDAAILSPGDNGERTQLVHINGIVSPGAMAGGHASPFARLDTSSPYALIGDLETGLVIDTRNKTLMQGGPGDYPELFAGRYDTIALEGDYSAGFDFKSHPGIEQVSLRGGYDYNLIASDDTVGAGGLLTVNAMPLRDANHVLFDGSAETDGSFIFYGSDADDLFIGGAGDDLVYGLGGADVLSGGGGRDTFVYYDAAYSSGSAYDILADFDPATDRIDLEVAVTGFDAAISTGTLSSASFDADLGTALAGLGAGKAVLYSASEGDLAGNVFLIVDANGVAGYQAGEDYVFALAGTTLQDLSGQTGFFI